MPRIRTIKPEFWDSPGIETLDPKWRLLYIAMWNWADDTGRGKCEARELMGFAFPRDEDMTLGEFRRGLGEVRRVFGVDFYQVDGRSFYAIPSWEKHQKIDHRSGSRWPAPEQGVRVDPELNIPISTPIPDSSVESPESPPSPRGDDGAGTGEQGNRGTGEIELLLSDSDESDPELGSLIPPEWRPNQTHIDKAAALHLDVKAEYQRFRDSAERKHRRLKNWNTGFTNWLRKQAEFNQERQGRPPVGRQSKDDRAREVLEMGRRLQEQHEHQQGVITA